MDRVRASGVRAICVCALGGAAGALGSCRHAEGPPVGVSHGTGVVEDAGAREELASSEVDVRKNFPVELATKHASLGHFLGAYEVAVRGNELAQSGLVRVDESFPEGARLLAVHFAPGDAGNGPTFLMQKVRHDAGGGWEFSAVGTGVGFFGAEATELCARCHADAPHDGVFTR